MREEGKHVATDINSGKKPITYLVCLYARFQLLSLFEAELPDFSQEFMRVNENSGA